MKNQIRNRYRQIRSNMSLASAEKKSRLAAQLFLNSDLYKNSKIIMLYMPLKNETDTKEIIRQAFADGKSLVFPVTEKESGEITPYFAGKDTVFKKGNFSVYEPCGTQKADPKMIDAVLVPGLAFDVSGNRIGFGKGCYDKFLQGISAVKIGFCYDFQVCEGFAAESFDIKMNFLITEKSIRKCERDNDKVKKISEIDKNFKINTSIEKDDIRFYNALDKVFRVNGVFYENGKFRRMPEKLARTISEGVYALHANTAGGRIRFMTDSPYVAISAKLDNVCRSSHFPLTGSAGFDMYVKKNGKEVYTNTFIPPYNFVEGYESIFDFEAETLREITINFPLYTDVCELYIGVSDKAFVGEPSPYKYEKPIIYYGSSITQGGCASIPGHTYQSIVSRRLGCDFVNLGFSGNAMAEDKMIDYIKKLDMSAFVFDYDHNAPTVEYLENTHKKMFKAIREENPDLPIVMMSRPKLLLTEDEKLRLEIIENTYKDARVSGDKNVYFIAGTKLMEFAGSDGTVDGCHPTDLGFASMAKTLGDVLEEII